MIQKTPKTSPSLGGCGPHLIHQCLGRPHSPPQTAAQLSHKAPLVTAERPIFIPKNAPSHGEISTLSTCLILGPSRPTILNGIQIQLSIFPQSTGHTDTHTNPTDGPGDKICYQYLLTLY